MWRNKQDYANMNMATPEEIENFGEILEEKQ